MYIDSYIARYRDMSRPLSRTATQEPLRTLCFTCPLPPPPFPAGALARLVGSPARPGGGGGGGGSDMARLVVVGSRNNGEGGGTSRPEHMFLLLPGMPGSIISLSGGGGAGFPGLGALLGDWADMDLFSYERWVLLLLVV